MAFLVQKHRMILPRSHSNKLDVVDSVPFNSLERSVGTALLSCILIPAELTILIASRCPDMTVLIQKYRMAHSAGGSSFDLCADLDFCKLPIRIIIIRSSPKHAVSVRASRPRAA